MSSNVYQIVVSQFPEFMRTDESYSKFFEFLVDYYKQVPDIDIVDERDIDKTKYLDKFVSEYAHNFNKILTLNDKQQRVVLQNIIDIYKAKGSIDSITSFMSIIFGVKSEIFLPSTQVFKTSAAKWNRTVSVRFKLKSGLLNSFKNIDGTIITSTSTINIDISKIEKVDGTTDLFEAFIDNIQTKLLIPTGGTLVTDSFIGTLQTTPTKKTILKPGLKFVVGDIFEILNSGGNGTKIKVKAVNSDTGLKSFDIIQFGINYQSNFITDIQPYFGNIKPKVNNLSVTVSGTQPYSQQYSSPDSVNKITDSILISKFDYTMSLDYFQDNTYVGELKQQSSSDAINIIDTDNFASTVSFELGYVLEYPGYYSTNIGFLDDASYLHDGEYYQQFSYVIKSGIDYSQYEDALKQLLHPAGMKAFGELRVDKAIDLFITISDRLNKLETQFNDTIRSSDVINNKIVIKPISDSANALDVLSKTLQKKLNDVVNLTDSQIKLINKVVNDTATASENLTKYLNKSISDSVTTFESIPKLYTKIVPDTVVSFDSGCIFSSSNYYIFSDVSLYGGLYWDCGYVANETYFAPITYLLVDNAGSRLLDGNGNLIKVNG